MFEEGVFATPAIYPAVRYGEAIVRTSYMATHTDEDLDRVLDVFAKLARELGTFEDPAYTGDGDGRRKTNVFDFRLQEPTGKDTLPAIAGTPSDNGSPVLPVTPR